MIAKLRELTRLLGTLKGIERKGGREGGREGGWASIPEQHSEASCSAFIEAGVGLPQAHEERTGRGGGGDDADESVGGKEGGREGGNEGEALGMGRGRKIADMKKECKTKMRR